jgi:UDPglucose--hexose-1-phosphate uridylyltransferase
VSARHTIALADGRELIYFDDRPGLDRSAPDRRPLVPGGRPASELRRDPIRDDLVIVAAHRQNRTNLPSASACPLCPSTADRFSEIPASDYHVVVFENRFPSLGNSEAAPGRCEVICFTSAHDASFAGLPAERLATVARAWVDRTALLSRLPHVEQVFLFENRGEAIGATLQHPHGQLYAYPFVTSYTARALASASRWQAERGGCLFCAIVAKELAAQQRIVVETEHCVAFVPEAPRFPYEVHLYPRRHVPDLPALTEVERDELVRVYAGLLRRFDGLFGRPIPYLAGWHQAPVREGRALAHLSMQLLSPQRNAESLKFFASSEAGMGAYTIDLLPEEAAARLRAVPV